MIVVISSCYQIQTTTRYLASTGIFVGQPKNDIPSSWSFTYIPVSLTSVFYSCASHIAFLSQVYACIITFIIQSCSYMMLYLYKKNTYFPLYSSDIPVVAPSESPPCRHKVSNAWRGSSVGVCPGSGVGSCGNQKLSDLSTW